MILTGVRKDLSVEKKKDLKCWEITQCKRSEGCPAREEPDRPCWEIAAELEDYRSTFHVCKDCLVYVAKNEDSSLSEEEFENIIASKQICVLASKCPKFVGEESGQ